MKRNFPALLIGTVATSFLLCVSSIHAATYSVMYSFQGGYDGVNPSYALIDAGGVLYGTTEYGGGGSCEDDNGYGCGTVFSLDPATGAETVLYSFENYGTDGSNPYSPLMVRGNALFGTTYWGPNDAPGGTIFKIDIASGTAKVLFSFPTMDGCFPTGALAELQGTLYGTTSSCAGGGGTMFGFTPKTRSASVIYSFCSEVNCDDGGAPNGNLIYEKKKFYGTGIMGGGNNAGAIFAVDPRTGNESVVHTFCAEQNCGDGAYPNGGLTYLNGLWYGTAQSGGASNYGTVFSINLSSGALSVVHAFSGGTADGAFPETGLVRMGSKLYGTTSFGGGAGCNGVGCGTVFSIDPKTAKETVLYTFCRAYNCIDGSNPSSILIDAKGALYGTTAYGGRGGCNLNYPGCGTVYSITP